MSFEEPPSPLHKTWERLDTLAKAVSELDKTLAIATSKVDARHGESQRRFDAQDRMLGSIQQAQDLTNGNVSKLGRWRDFMAGAIAIIVAVLLPMCGYLLKLWLDKAIGVH